MGSVTRIAQHRMNEHLRTKDIVIGAACVKASKVDDVEVWVLPGCKVTRNRAEAVSVCKKMHALILELGGIKPKSAYIKEAA